MTHSFKTATHGFLLLTGWNLLGGEVKPGDNRRNGMFCNGAFVVPVCLIKLNQGLCFILLKVLIIYLHIYTNI